MKKINLILLSAILGTTIFSSCRKAILDTQNTIVSAEDNSSVETEFAATFDVVNDISTTDGKLQKTGSTILPSGAVVVFIDSLFTDGNGVEYYIDFGPKGTTAPFGLLCKDGRYRAGKINVSASGRYLNIGTVVTVNIASNDNFFTGDGTNMTQISGTKTLTRVDQKTVNVDVKNATAINKKGTITWEANRTITQTYDNGPGVLGDIFEITGNASGKNRNGDDFTVIINTPLKKKLEEGCANTFISGTLTLTNLSTNRKIDVNFDPYNNEACDKTVEATILGKKHIFTVN